MIAKRKRSTAKDNNLDDFSTTVVFGYAFPVLKELAFLYIKEKILKIGNEISIHTIAFSTNSEYAISKRDLIT